MGKKSGPPPPDYTKLAQQTADSQNDQLLQQTYANRITQNNPWGSVSYQATAGTDPATGKPVTNWAQNTTLNAQQQKALDDQMGIQSGRSDIASGLMGQVGQQMKNGPLDFSGFTQLANTPGATQSNPFGFGTQNINTALQQTPNLNMNLGQGAGQGMQSSLAQQNVDTSRQSVPQLQSNFGQGAGTAAGSLNYGNLQNVDQANEARQKAYDSVYSQAASRLDPQWQNQQTQLETSLANKGITEGSAGYQQAMDQFQRQKADAYNQAQMSATQAAGQQAQIDSGINMGLRQQQASEAQNAANYGLQAQGQNFGQNQSALQSQNAALAQQFGLGQSAQQSQLQAQQAAFGQAQQAGAFQNQAQQQAYDQMLGAGQAQNAAMGQAFGFGNQARASQLAAQQQAYGQDQSYSQQNFAQNQAANAQNYSQQMQSAQYQNQLRQQQIAEAQQQQNWSLNALNALLNGQQVGQPSFANFNSAGQGQGVDFSGAGDKQFQAGMQQQQMQNQAIGNIVQGAAGAAMMFSDRRIKTDIKRIGRHPRGFGIYRYRFIGETLPRVGVLAQEVKRVMPGAVRSFRGVLMVNYSALSVVQ